MKSKSFEIKILEIHWISDATEETDQCAHGQIMIRIGDEIVVNRRDKENHWTLSAMAVHLLRTIDKDHMPNNLVAEHLVPCCGHHIDHIDSELDVHIQGCFTGINFWVRHTNDGVVLKSEKGIEIKITRQKYINEIIDFVDNVEEFYKISKPKIIPQDEYDKIGLRKFWEEWGRRRIPLGMKNIIDLKIRGVEINLDVFKEEINHFKTLEWNFNKWAATPAIRDNSGSTSKFVGQKYNPEQWQYLEDGWSHDDCEICFMALFDSDNVTENYGYINKDEDWLCFECYHKLVEQNFKENFYVLKEKFRLSNDKSILFVSPILENQKIKISRNSKFGQSKLEYYFDKPRKLLRNGELDDQIFAIMLKDKEDISNFEIDKLYELINE